MGKRFWILTVVGVLVLLAAGGGGGYVLLQRRDQARQRAAAASFAHAWQTGGLATIAYSGSDAASVAKQAQAATAGLTSATQDRPTSVTVTGLDRSGKEPTASLAVGWTLTGHRSWNYTSTLPLRKDGGRWLPVWQPSVLHPRLSANATLKTLTKDAARGRILGAGGQVLVTERPVVVVGIQPSRADDPAVAARAVAAVVHVDAENLVKRVNAAGKDTFVQAIVLRKAAYLQVRDRLQRIPAAVFQERTLSLAPSSTFARALLGTIGPATADVVKESKGRVQADQIAGLSGVQRAYDQQLAGSPGLSVQLSGPNAKSILFTVPPQEGKDLQLTLDRSTQQAAEKALTAATHPAALVAIKASTGEVLAVANGGPNAEGYNRALLGRYPPGSTFKVVSGLALLGAGVTPTTPIRCPSSVVVGGKSFTNAEDEQLGTVAFRSDFANSCNTAFVGSASKVTSAELARTSRLLGYGRKNQVGVETFTGSVPSSDDPVLHAASMIGQGEVLTSPLTVAGTSAAVASGTWHAPHLLAATTPATAKLPPGQVKKLRSMMRQVVTGGTATIMRSTPGGPVYGKTGTAEFGSDKPPRTHAWFTGYQKDLAFAVIVEDGGFGAKAAAPIAKAFLTSLAP